MQEKFNSVISLEMKCNWPALYIIPMNTKKKKKRRELTDTRHPRTHSNDARERDYLLLYDVLLKRNKQKERTE